MAKNPNYNERAAAAHVPAETIDAQTGEVLDLKNITNLVVNKNEDKFLVDETFVQTILNEFAPATFQDFRERISETAMHADEEFMVDAIKSIIYYHQLAQIARAQGLKVGGRKRYGREEVV